MSEMNGLSLGKVAADYETLYRFWETAVVKMEQHQQLITRLTEALELSAKRIDLLTNWIENTYGGSNGDVQLGRQYAAATRQAAAVAKERAP